jgi:hypothetical protein
LAESAGAHFYLSNRPIGAAQAAAAPGGLNTLLSMNFCNELLNSHGLLRNHRTSLMVSSR